MIGKNIQEIRKQKGLTLSELALRANVSKSYLSNIERNLNMNPSIQIMEKLAKVLGVDLRKLIDLKSDKSILEHEWLEFIKDLQESGVEKEQLQEYKSIIEYAKWQNKKIEKE
ncbi:helix-turn-helix domain-containing protein [Virgibacillus sp. DJP39]|uniref:helix-turn-helix domain-containing protein n=1 Tax=Virgibacillus sp. DJP39 TaxID=3409790 RepID=UPI003BB768CF